MQAMLGAQATQRLSLGTIDKAEDDSDVIYTTNRLGASFQYTFSQVPPVQICACVPPHECLRRSVPLNACPAFALICVLRMQADGLAPGAGLHRGAALCGAVLGQGRQARVLGADQRRGRPGRLRHHRCRQCPHWLKCRALGAEWPSALPCLVSGARSCASARGALEGVRSE